MTRSDPTRSPVIQPSPSPERGHPFLGTLVKIGLARTLHGYISANEAFIPNYGDRYRHDEIISTAFVESTVNQVISKRFVKKQQMRWTQWGAHLLLQTRVQVLNEDLRNTFCRWFPAMNADHPVELKAA